MTSIPTSLDLSHTNQLFNALNSPLRLRLISLLHNREHTVSELSASTAKSQPLVSQHLKILKNSGIVEFNKRGRSSHYRLTDLGIINLIQEAAVFALENVPPESGSPVS
ncbi:ArsR/SmtB family transcription factor [Corynebacterium sp. A21]|uniref:ArsR/SmtB family transcription factor n=1 Tax=Corynebacterium sp. A21 TaxID=3457318 RepID=UPI003FD09596